MGPSVWEVGGGGWCATFQKFHSLLSCDLVGRLIFFDSIKTKGSHQSLKASNIICLFGLDDFFALE